MTDLSSFSMFDLFATEVETQGQQLTDGLLALENSTDPATDAEPLMRAAHSIKGAARVVGIDCVVTLAHAMEDAFVAAQHGTVVLNAEAIDALLVGVDLMDAISKQGEDGIASFASENQERLDAAAATYREIQQGRLPESTAGASPAPESEPAPEPVAEPEPAPVVETPTPTPVATPTPSPAPEAPVEAPEPVAAGLVDDPSRVVRVTAESLSRLLGYAGEALVQTRWSPKFIEDQRSLRRHRIGLPTLEDDLRRAIQEGQPGRALDILDRVQASSVRTDEMLSEQMTQFDNIQQQMTRLAGKLYQEVIASRMRPFSDGAGGFARMVRSVGRSLGKTTSLEIVGEKTPVDRDILEKLEAPLTHLLRNAVDHGIEATEDRLAAGKSQAGRIQLRVQHAAGMLSIALADDGGGIDVESIRQKVIDRGHAGADMAEQMSREELLEFLFLPGFSTREQVSETSGRGVGLDVVQTMLQEVRGSVRIESQVGVGTTFRLQLPLTLSVIPSLLVEIDGERYAFPLYRIDHCLHVDADEIEQVEGQQYIATNDVNVGLVSSRQVLEYHESDTPPTSYSIVVVSNRSESYGFIVDRFLGERDLVIRPMSARLGKVPDVYATAVSEEGLPLIVLDVDDMIHSAEQILSTGRLVHVRPDIESQTSSQKRILVVDDSITVREVQRRLLEAAGYDVEVAVDGVDGWNAVRAGQFDLLISDIDMPRMNGIELLRHVRAEPRLHNLPVMVVSYKDREEDRIAGLEAGANYYLTKSSFQNDTLLRAVSDLIGEVS